MKWVDNVRVQSSSLKASKIHQER